MTGPVDCVNGPRARECRDDGIEISMVAAIGMKENDARTGSRHVHGHVTNPEDPARHAVRVHDFMVIY